MQLSSLVLGLACAGASVAAPAPLELRTNGPSCPTASAAYLASVKQQFATDMIVPDLIERINPTVKVDVAYGAKAVQLGTYFTTLQTLSAPKLSFSAEPGYNPAIPKYTYFLVDPDVPQDGSPVQVNFLHWMVSHAQPSCITQQSPQTVVQYQALTPASTTQHRYTFLVYREPANFNPNADVTLQLRTPFDLNDYVQDNGLVLVGGNFLKESITNGVVG